MTEPGVDPEGASLVEAVRAWVGESGYALELRIAEAFGSSSSLGQHYEDTVQPGTWRETDVIFTRADQKVQVVVHYVIEAKATTSPWVLFRGNRPFIRDESLLQTLHHAAVHAGTGNIVGVHRSPLLTHAGETAYKLATMHKAKAGQQEKNEAWQATMQVLSAARALAADAQEQMSEHLEPLVQLFVPILLTSGPLLAAQLTDQGIEVEEVQKGLLVGQFPPDGLLRAVWVVQDAYLDELVAEAQPVPSLDVG